MIITKLKITIDYQNSKWKVEKKIQHMKSNL